MIQWLIPKAPVTASKTILIISTTGLGDTIWATPAIRSLKGAFPNARIDLLTTGLGKEALFHNPHLNEVYVITYQSLLSLRKILWRNRYEAVLIFHASQRFIFPLSALIGARKTISTQHQNKGLDRLITDLIPAAPIHEIERRFRLVEVLYPKIERGPLEIPIQEDEMQEALFFLKKSGWDGKQPLVVLQPGAKDHFKLWPAEYYIETAHALAHISPFFLITGSMSEAAFVKNIARDIPNSIPLFGQISLRSLICLIHRADLMITNDTGPMHLAFSQNTPTIALFAPTDPRFCGPYFAQTAFVISKRRTCIPCLKKRCRDPFCMRQIPVKDVVSLARQILEDRS